jgi:peptidoglycan hydrolase-like protein with peptidoglycan-binding domain/DNA invertase Pin-like site-specific DNA recombinase
MQSRCFALLARSRLVGLLVVCPAMSLTAIGLAPTMAQAASPAAHAGQPDAQTASRSRVLRLGAGYGRAGGSRPVRQLQRRLHRLGQRPGPVDGLFGPLTRAAVERFQARQGLVHDGVVGPRTQQALHHPFAGATVARGAGYTAPRGSRAVRRLQRRLRRLGVNPGPIDGRYGPLTQSAVERFQAKRGLPVDGIAGPQTLRTLQPHARRPHKTGGRTRTAPRPSQPTVHRPAPSSHQPTPSRHVRPSRGHGGDAIPIALGALAAALALLGLAVLVVRRQRPPEESARSNSPSPIPPSLDAGAGMSPVPERHAESAMEVRPEETPRQAMLGYLSRARTREGVGNGELETQAAAIDEACRERGLRLLEVVRDSEPSNARMLDRPGLTYVLDRISARTANGVVVSRLESLSRSVPDIGALVERFERADARLVALDLGLDTATPDGRIAARTMATVSSLERRKLAEQTRQGSARAQIGRSPISRRLVDQDELKSRIAAMRADGMTLQTIADTLNAEGVPTLRGGARWRPSGVQAATGYKRPTRKDNHDTPRTT